jgi:hypothetical protein
MNAPIAPKAQAAGVTAAVSGAALYLLSKYIFKGNVPDGVASMVYVAVPAVLTFLAAYFAPHQVRPGDVPGPVPASGGTSSVSLSGAEMDAVRDALASGRMEQTAADERKVPPAKDA